MKFSFINAPITNKTPSKEVTIEDVYKSITAPSVYKKITDSYREIISNPESDERLKRITKIKSFDYVTFSGCFTYVSSEGLITLSKLICIDIDGLEDTTEVKNALLNDPEIDTALLFKSPSGNGIKWIVKIAIETVNGHLDYFHAIKNYLYNRYTIEIDEACRDIARACFLCYDPEAVINKTAKELPWEFIQNWGDPNIAYNPGKKTATTNPTSPWDQFNSDFDVSSLLLKKGYSFVKSDERGDKYLRPGGTTSEYSLIVFKDTNLIYVHSSSCPNLDPGLYTPSKLYCHLECNGDWSEAARTMKKMGYLDGPLEEEKATKISGKVLPADTTIYWKFEKTKNGFKCLLDPSYYFEFISKELEIGVVSRRGKDVEIVKNSGQILEKVNYLNIPRYVKEYNEQKIKPYDQKLNHLLSNAIITSRELTSSETSYKSHLKKLTPQVTREKPDSALLYFSNGYLEVKADSIKFLEFSTLENSVWRSDLLDRDWKGKADYSKSNFWDFLKKVAGDSEKRLSSLRSSIGYLLHSHKDPANAKIVVYTDEHMSENLNSANGGTGKSICISALSKMKKTRILDGKDFKGNSSFVFSNVEEGDKIVAIDDIKASMNFDDLFIKATSDFRVEHKGLDAFYIDFKDAPKMLIGSNYPIKGQGSSFVRRQLIVEFSPFFNPERTVSGYYNETFFGESWTEEDWQQFDTLMVECIQLYLQEGIHQVDINYGMKRLLSEIGPEFYEWAEESLKLDVFYPSSELLHGVPPVSNIRGFRLEFPEYQLSNKGLNIKLSIWAEYKGYNLVKKRTGSQRGFILTKNKTT